MKIRLRIRIKVKQIRKAAQNPDGTFAKFPVLPEE
jgi:hypothetical protein